MPGVGRSPLLVPVAFATLFIGFLIVVSRKKAITQVLGYLMMENGVFVFGMSLAYQLPFVVEFGILLDVLVAILVFGVLIQHISAEFDSIDTDVLSELKD
jgi:hydrogenase-4 component E